MRSGIINLKRDCALDCGVLALLPPHLACEIEGAGLARVDEIRLRRDGICTLTSDTKTLPLRGRVDGHELSEILKRLCDGSMYAHGDTINRGYVVYKNGVRVGVCGRAVTEGGKVTGVYDVSSLCIRLPHRVPSVGGPVAELLRHGTGGVLVFSPPGVGKTTLLRGVLSSVTRGEEALRCAVIDTRGELSAFLPRDSCADVLSGYPRGAGIDIASRLFNPQLIVCDEVGGDMDEALAIAAAHNCGVKLLASSHGSDVRSLLRRPAVSLLHEKGIFSHYVGISRRAGECDYLYETVRADEL